MVLEEEKKEKRESSELTDTVIKKAKWDKSFKQYWADVEYRRHQYFNEVTEQGTDERGSYWSRVTGNW